ncbi:MAG TPA: hypothetical protein IAA54_03200 [Candidatus Gallacutalibacter pullicola]|uniref:Uncharacterized protein n=1 Tax=Candidatus Gallacutalibacter pullicola TaxID=2840830 RepID=A0A9D1DPL8_9FIRM|nr:hypothetical protein [Candidatus Gallacutalibacter pullicola]
MENTKAFRIQTFVKHIDPSTPAVRPTCKSYRTMQTMAYTLTKHTPNHFSMAE